MRNPKERKTTALAAGTMLTGALVTPVWGAAAADDVNQALGLRASEIISLDVGWTPGEDLLAVVPIEGHPVVLQLSEHSVRSDIYEVWQQVQDGSLVRVEPGPVRTMRGSLIGVDGTVAAGSFLEDGLHAVIRFDDGERVWLEPLGDRVPGSRPNDYVVYRDEDVTDEGGTCDALEIPGAPDVGGADAAFTANRGTASAGSLCTAQLACDADFEYFLDYGSANAVQNRIDAIVNTVNIQYERDVAITHVITTIIVRTAEPDPYSSTDAVTLLNQFRNHWLANHGNIVRDAAQLFTGKEINGGTIGIAWLNAVCTSYGFSVVQSDFNNNYACATDLTAHELGHNWGADHCSCTSYTMNPFITCANVFHPTFSIPEIIAFRDSRTCLDCGGVPIGACCFDDGSCQILTSTDCGAQNGTYQGDDVTCQQANCPQPPPTGACCLVDDSCVEVTSDECAAQNGAYEGDGTDCATTQCGGGGPVEAPLSCLNVTQGTQTGGGLAQLDASDNAYVTVASTTSGRKRRTQTIVCADSPSGSVSTMTLTVESRASTSNVKTSIHIRKTNGKWTRLTSYTESQSDAVRVINVSDPNRFIRSSDVIEVRITSERRNANHTLFIDHVEIMVTP